MPIQIKLEPHEAYQAAAIGVSRHVESLRNGNKCGKFSKRSGFDIHISGAMGELAFCKAMGIYWSGSVNTFKDADVARSIQIRTSSNDALIVRPKDSKSEVYVLVKQVAEIEFFVIGWMTGKQAMVSDWWAGDAWFVPGEKTNQLPETSSILLEGQ